MAQDTNNRRSFLLAAFGLLATSWWVRPVQAAPEKITPRPVDDDCPLNSGGPSLLGSTWRVRSVYGNTIPRVVNMSLKVGSNTLTGNAGCNNYVAQFQQVGHTGFKVKTIKRGMKGCRSVSLYHGGPSANIVDLESGFLKTLRRMGSVQQLENSLVFYNLNGSRAIVLDKA